MLDDEAGGPADSADIGGFEFEAACTPPPSPPSPVQFGWGADADVEGDYDYDGWVLEMLSNEDQEPDEQPVARGTPAVDDGAGRTSAGDVVAVASARRAATGVRTSQSMICDTIGVDAYNSLIAAGYRCYFESRVGRFGRYIGRYRSADGRSLMLPGSGVNVVDSDNHAIAVQQVFERHIQPHMLMSSAGGGAVAAAAVAGDVAADDSESVSVHSSDYASVSIEEAHSLQASSDDAECVFGPDNDDDESTSE